MMGDIIRLGEMSLGWTTTVYLEATGCGSLFFRLSLLKVIVVVSGVVFAGPMCSKTLDAPMFCENYNLRVMIASHVAD